MSGADVIQPWRKYFDISHGRKRQLVEPNTENESVSFFFFKDLCFGAKSINNQIVSFNGCQTKCIKKNSAIRTVIHMVSDSDDYIEFYIDNL